MRRTARRAATTALIFTLPLLAGCSTVGHAVVDVTSAIIPVSWTRKAETPETMMADDLSRARALRQQGHPAEAGRILSQLVLVNPDDGVVLGEYGKTLAAQGRGHEAVAFLSRAALTRPNDWTLYSALGVAYDQNNDAAHARLVYEHALQLKPNDSTVLNNYALSRAMAGDIAGAQKLIELAAAKGSNTKVAGNQAMIEKLAQASGQTLRGNKKYQTTSGATATANAAPVLHLSLSGN
ncbi:MAG: tetratricopeptide repeat protein [Rhizomicrobium sp.]